MQGFKKAALLKESKDSGRFAARQNQAIDAGQLVGLADLDWNRTSL